MAKSGRAESQSISTVVDAGRRWIAMNLTLWRQRTNSTAADESLSASDGVEKIIRFYPRAVIVGTAPNYDLAVIRVTPRPIHRADRFSM